MQRAMAGQNATTKERAATKWAVVLLLLLIAAAVRFLGLGSESLWLDEATSLVVADNPPAVSIALTAEDIHPPLYYLLLHVWLIFGRSEAAIRSFSAVVGVLSVLALYGLAREVWGERPARLAGLLLALAPLHVWYSQEARMYALVTFWAILSTWAMVRFWRSGRWPASAGYALTTAAGMYTHYYMGFVVLAQNAFILFLLLRRRGAWRDRLLPWIAGQAVWIALFAPWVPVVMRQIQGGGGEWVSRAVGRPGLRILGETYIAFTVGLLRAEMPLLLRRGLYLLYAVLLAAGLWGLWREARRPTGQDEGWTAGESGALCLLWGGLPISLAWLVSQVKPIYALRYMLPFLPPFIMLVAWGVETVWSRRREAGLLLAGILLASSAWGTWLMAETPQKPDWRDLTAALVAQQEPGDVVVPEPFWNAKPLRYYADGALTIYDGAPLPATPAGAAKVVAELQERATRVWLIEDVGHYGDPDRLLKGAFDQAFSLLEHDHVAGIGDILLYRVR